MSSGIEIILVDDDQALRRATRQTLELAGYAVHDFGDDDGLAHAAGSCARSPSSPRRSSSSRISFFAILP